MKKFPALLTLLLGIVAMSTPLLVGAQAAPGGSDFVALAPITGLTDPSSVTSVINSQNLASFFNNLYKFCIGLAAALAVIMIIWGGLEISTQDSISKQGAGKEKIQNAIYGLLLVLSPVLVFSIINPAILNLSLNLRPLDTASVPPIVTAPTVCDTTSLTPADSALCRQAAIDKQNGVQTAATQAVQEQIDLNTQTCKNQGGEIYRSSEFLQDGICSPAAKKQFTGGCVSLKDGSICGIIKK